MSALTDVFTNIGNALRSKMGVSTTFRPDQMAPAINNIPSGVPVNEIVDYKTTKYFMFVREEGKYLEVADKSHSGKYNFANTSMVFNKNYANSLDVSDGVNSGVYNLNSLSFTNYNVRNGDISNYSYITYEYSETDFANTYKYAYIGEYMYKVSFTGCEKFDNPVIFDNNCQINDIKGMFESCYNYNKPLTVPSNVTSLSSLFAFCSKFNQAFSIPDNITDVYRTFAACRSLNSPIHIGPNSNITDMTNCFMYCQQLNQSINIGPKVVYMNNCFFGCNNLNQSINIGPNVVYMNGCFFGCNNLNTVIRIPSSVRNVHQAFGNIDTMNNFGVIIENGITNISNMFFNCCIYNRDLIIPDSVTKADNTFVHFGPPNESMPQLNVNIKIGRGLTNIDGMFRYIGYGSRGVYIRFMEGKGIIIPNTVQSMINAFGYINIPRLYFEDSTNTPNVGGMFGGNKWGHTTMYIHCNNAAPFLNANLLNKDSSTPLAWNTMTNGYRYTFPSNSMRSIYLYTNYSPS